MKQITLVFFSLLFSWNTNGQSFTKVITGDVVNTDSGSRSANFIDINGDGWDDIFISNGPSGGQNNMLYLNNQDGTFTSIVDDPIVSDGAKSDGATFGDADNDGDLDACVVTWYGQKNNYYRGVNGWYFFNPENIITEASTYSETASWGDMDNDGWLDLYITNSEGNKKNKLFRNLGDGTFEEITTGPMVESIRTSRSVDWIDYDSDGDSDIFVTNESNEKNELFQNNGSGEFTKLSNIEFLNSAKNSAGSSWADIDNDGDFDLFVANYQGQENQLFLNNNNGTFTSVNQGAIVQDLRWSFGSAFADADNDGDVDLYVCNAFGGIDKNSFYINDGNGIFERDDQSAPATQSGWTFGCAWGDYNQDGFMDLVLANCKNDNQTNSLFRNDGNENNWFKLKCEGTQTNRSAIGTVVRIKAIINGKSVWQMRRIAGQSGYNSQNSLVVHFGLKDASMIDSLIIDWGVGESQIIENVTINRSCKIKQGEQLECTTTSTIDNVVHMPKVKIHPNPSNGNYFQMENPFELNKETISVRVIDTTGRLIYQTLLENPESKIVITNCNLGSGSYQVVLSQNNKMRSSTLIVR
jgi:hypothetical protein